MNRREAAVKGSWLWTAAGAGLAAYALTRSLRERSLSGKIVAITGGSRGLGLQLAREFAAEGCSLVLCARGQAELRRARKDLEEGGTQVLTVPCDVTDQRQVDHFIDKANDAFGQIDVLVNNAGTIQVGPVENMELHDFREAMDLIFYGTLQPTLTVLPQMLNRREGVIVNITSIGGKVPVPHLLPYCCAKFASVGFSEGLAAEVASKGVQVLTVAPGTMQTGSYVNAQFRGDVVKEAEWFSASETLPLLAMSMERAAREIVTAVKRGESELVMPASANLMARLHGAFPELSIAAAGWANRMLPGPSRSTEKVSGLEIQRRNISPKLRHISELARPQARRAHQPA